MTEERAKQILENAKALVAMSHQMREVADDTLRKAVTLHMDAVRIYHDALKLNRKIRWRNYLAFAFAIVSLILTFLS